MRIEICGGIGAGKTTLAKLIGDNLYPCTLENFKMNPFWKPFYSNPDKYNFETELTFLLQHYHDIKVAKTNHTNFICDFSFTQDLAYAIMGLKDNRLKLFEDVMNEGLAEVSQPDLLIYLQCDEFTLLNRIKARGRDEENSISVDFLQFLNSYIEKVVKEESKVIEILILNSKDINFANDEEGKQYVLKLISDKCNSLSAS